MMSLLLACIKADQLSARKEKRAVTASLLTTLIGEASMVGKNAGRETTDAEVVATIRKFLKGVDESLRVAGDYRDDAQCTVLWEEKTALESYLPRQMDKSELKRVLTQFNAENANKGVLMKFLKDNFAGQYDGKLAAQVVDEFLAV
jgi:uncharacterized protein